MGTPVQTGTWTGDSPGQMSIIDYSSDWTLLNERLNTLIVAVDNLTAALAAPNSGVLPLQLAAFNASFGPGSANTSPGTVPAAIKGISGHLDAQVTAQASIANNLSSLNNISTAGSDQIAATINSTLSTQNALAQIYIAQQNKKAEFEKAATQSALERSNLPPVEVPQTDINEAIKSSVTDAGEIAVQASVNGFVQSTISSGASYVTEQATNFITDTALYQAAVAKVDAIKASIGSIGSAADATSIDASAKAADARDATSFGP